MLVLHNIYIFRMHFFLKKLGRAAVVTVKNFIDKSMQCKFGSGKIDSRTRISSFDCRMGG